jgi:hypothetical protein
MKLHRNQQCPIHRSLYCCGRELVLKKRSVKQLGLQRIEDAHHPRGYRELRSNAEMRKLLNRKIVEQNRSAEFATIYLQTITTSFRTTSIPKEWEERGETIILTISRPCIGGAMERKDQAESRQALNR